MARKYSDELVKIVPKPPGKIEIKPIETTNAEGGKQKYIVLPENYINSPSLTLGSKQFNDVIEKHPEVKKQLETEEKAVVKFESSVNKAIEATQKAADKEEARKSWLSRLFTWGGILGIGGVIGLIALVIFAPELLPVIFNLFKQFISVFVNLIRAFASLFTKKSPS